MPDRDRRSPFGHRLLGQDPVRQHDDGLLLGDGDGEVERVALPSDATAAP